MLRQHLNWSKCFRHKRANLHLGDLPDTIAQQVEEAAGAGLCPPVRPGKGAAGAVHPSEMQLRTGECEEAVNRARKRLPASLAVNRALISWIDYFTHKENMRCSTVWA